MSTVVADEFTGVGRHEPADSGGSRVCPDPATKEERDLLLKEDEDLDPESANALHKEIMLRLLSALKGSYQQQTLSGKISRPSGQLLADSVDQMLEVPDFWGHWEVRVFSLSFAADLHPQFSHPYVSATTLPQQLKQMTNIPQWYLRFRRFWPTRRLIFDKVSLCIELCTAFLTALSDIQQLIMNFAELEALASPSHLLQRCSQQWTEVGVLVFAQILTHLDSHFTHFTLHQHVE